MDTSVGSGGLDIVGSGGINSGATISGGAQSVYGYAVDTTVLAGTQIVQSGGTAGDTVLSGGRGMVGAGGTDVSASILGGEQDVFGYAVGVKRSRVAGD